ncbi:uncharacterized protein [Asterias amurensis]|uniref:uncharacterized protein n=1 Tax=Asterias amurensis TaxID=7602 RepID=UPI003AB40871
MAGQHHLGSISQESNVLNWQRSVELELDSCRPSLRQACGKLETSSLQQALCKLEASLRQARCKLEASFGPGQSNHPSWQDPSLGRQRAAAWNAQHQDSFSTYEEVESLHSHQCSSLQSLDNSCSPSRLQSFGSSSSSLDQALQQIEGESPFTSGVHIPIDQESSSCSREDRGSSLESESTNSVSVDGRQPVHLPKNTRKGHLPEKSRRSLIDEDEEEMNASVAKWVDQTRAETARRRSNVGLPKDPQVRSHEAPEGSNKPHDVTKERFLTALNMQCGDVIAGRSGSSVRLPNETDLELALRVGNSSPMNSISRGASIDGASIGSSAGEDHTKPEGGWTLAENVLIDLGFAGSNIGIPDRFLRSWKEQVMKQRIEEVRRLLGNSSGNYLVQHLPPKLGTSTPPTEKLSFVPSSKNLTAGPRTPQSQASAPQPSELSNSSQPEDAVLGRQQGADRSKLIGLRRSLKKAATVSSFGQTLSEIGKQSQPSQHVLAPQHSPDVPSASRRSQGGQKYSPLHKNHKSSARDRRRKYMKKQTSLPSSLEPLLEEDENSKPGMVKSKHANATKEAPAGMQLLKPHSPGMGREAGLPCKLKIVMEQPSIESREAMSRQGTTDVDVDEAIADVDTDNTPKVTMEQYLVVQAIIDSKDSGFENGPSQNGSPQMSPRSSEDETAKSMDARMKTCPANSGPLRRTKSSDSDSAVDRLLSITSPNQTKSSNIPAPLSFSIKPFQTQINKKQNPKRNDLPMRSVQPNLESSNPDVPVSTDAEGSFSQTTVEGDDTFQGSPTSTGETVSCQTSPNLHSPLLSPLFFLESISEHPDGTLDTDCSLQVFVMPDGAEESLSKNAGRSDSLESVMPTGDGLAKGTSQENKSQEISDGGLSMIAEKEEPCHEPTCPVAETEPHQKLLSPIIKTDGKKLEVASQHHFDELQHDSNTTENVESIKIPSHTTDKSRNPFKETKDFYASHHSDYDFDATIEEDEDGEQYSDGESFSKVTFSETPSMLSTFPVSSGSELKERNQDLETQDPCLCQVENDKENMQENAMTDEPVVTATDNIALQCEKSGAGEHNILEKEKDKVLSEASTIIHGNCIDVVTQHKQQNLETMPQGTEKSSSVTNSNKSERNDDRQDDYTRHSQGNHHSNPNTGIDAVEKQISSHIERHVKASDSDCSAAGNDFQIADKDKNIDEERLLSPTVKGSTLDEGLHLAESSEIQPDCPIVGEDTNNCIDSAATKLQNNPSVGFHKADVVKENFLAFVPGDKAEIPNPLPAVTNQLEEWNLGFDQRAIIRSISLEANMNHQKKKIRTLSERNTLYSDGMEPLLPGFGRVVTERSNASTEGFGSFGSDVFHRPLTVKQTLQQVASKLESLVRQRSLVSILDQEPEDDVKVRRRRTASLEESNREMLPTHSRKILTDFDPRDRRKKSLSRDKTKYSPLQEDEGYEEVNSIDESVVDSSGAEKNETNLSNIPSIKTAQIDSKLTSNKSLSHHNVSRETKTPTEEILTQNMKVHIKTHSIDQNGSSSNESQTSITKPSPGAVDKSKKRKNWQLQTSSGRWSSNFLTVPSFGSLNDSVDLISDNSSADREMRSVCHLTGGNGITPMIKQRLDCENLHGKSKNYLVSSVSDDSVGSSIALNVGAEDLYESPEDGCKCTVNNSNNDVESLTNSWSNTDLGCESVSVYVVENSSVPLKDVKTKDHPVMKSPQSVMSTSSENKERTTQVYEQNASSESGSNNTISVLVNNNQNKHISSDEKPDETSNYVFIRLQPPNGIKRSIQGTVAHSQFVRCEKYLNVATSSNGKVDFIESDNASMSHQVPTFLSEVQFLPLSDSSKRSSFQISEDIPSQGSVSLDCPSPVSSSRLSPTFEEICNKAGHLMHRLQNALATRASPAVEMSSPIMENKCEEAFVIEEEDSVEAGGEEEEWAAGFGRQ